MNGCTWGRILGTNMFVPNLHSTWRGLQEDDVILNITTSSGVKIRAVALGICIETAHPIKIFVLNSCILYLSPLYSYRQGPSLGQSQHIPQTCARHWMMVQHTVFYISLRVRFPLKHPLWLSVSSFNFSKLTSHSTIMHCP